MLLDLITVLVFCAACWWGWNYFRGLQRAEAMGRHPVATPCSLCENRDMPSEHPIRLHGPSTDFCRECGIRVNMDCWDAHWRLAHGVRPTAPEDSAGWFA